MFNSHLPPSADRPRVWTLDERAAADLPAEVELYQQPSPTPFDSVVGYASPDPTLSNLETYYNALRPGGRLILAAQAEPKQLLEALRQGGYIHCLVETEADGWTLYRGERPPDGQTLTTLADADNDRAAEAPFFYIPVTQTPNKPAWRLSPGETIQWKAPTVLDPNTHAPSLLAFSSLVRAVAFMQRAVLANTITGINKVGKFPRGLVKGWGRAFVLNPTFHFVRNSTLGAWVEVDPQIAITGEE